jgi:hypothetical protein
MAARVGTGVTFAIDGGATSIPSATKTTTSGNLLVAWVKWETAATDQTVTGLTDTALNSWSIISQGIQTAGEGPSGALCYAENITGNAANAVTATFSDSVVFSRIIVEEFSGILTASSLDQAVASGSAGTGSTYTTTNIATSTTGLVILGVSGYTALSGLSGTAGNPDFTIGAAATDAFIAYLISGSAQTVTPGASSGQSDRWIARAQAFKDAGGGGGTYNAVPQLDHYYRMISG